MSGKPSSSPHLYSPLLLLITVCFSSLVVAPLKTTTVLDLVVILVVTLKLTAVFNNWISFSELYILNLLLNRLTKLYKLNQPFSL